MQIYRRKSATIGMVISFTICIQYNDYAEWLRDRACERYMSAIE